MRDYICRYCGVNTDHQGMCYNCSEKYIMVRKIIKKAKQLTNNGLGKVKIVLEKKK